MKITNNIKLEITPTWKSVGSLSRYEIWNQSLLKISNWIDQKGYRCNKHLMCRKFAKHYNCDCTLTDSFILSSQHFKLFKRFVNELMKIDENATRINETEKKSN